MRTSLPLLIGLVACSGSPPDPPPEPAGPSLPDVILITLDTTRADRLGCYGDPLARTPNLDAFAKDAVLFREATTPVPLTLPAHASLFSGRYPSSHGLRDNGGFRLNADVPLLAETLRQAGYRTGGFVGAYVLDGAWGLSRGFDRYFDHFHPTDVAKATRFGAVERPAREVVREALAWYEDPGAEDAPQLLWVHLFDAHTPYEPPVDWKGDPYRGEVFEMDRALRPLLTSLPEDALVIIAADHGENLWDGRELEHGTVLSRSTLRVPLLVRPPGGIDGEQAPEARTLPPRPAAWTAVEGLSPEGLVLDVVPDAPVAGRVVGTPVSLVDLTPTILDVLDLEPPGPMDGRSLVPALEGQDLPVVPVYSESVAPYTHFGWAPQHVARDDHRLLRRDAGDTVFDPGADPWWQAPLEETPPPPLLESVDRFSRDWQHPGGTIDPATAMVLEQMGYAMASVQVDGDLPSARERIGSMHTMFLAQGRMYSEPEKARAALEALIQREPTLVDAWFSLSSLRWVAGDEDGAIQALESVVELAPDHPLAWNNLIVLERERGHLDKALEIATRMAHTHPTDSRWHRQRVDLLGRLERPKEVASACEEALAGSHRDDPFLWYMLGLARLQVDDPKGALQALNTALEKGTEAPDVHLWRGEAYKALEDVDGAVEAYKSQANATPADVRPTVAAGMLLVDAGRCDEALPLLLTAMQRGVQDDRIQAAYDRCGGL